MTRGYAPMGCGDYYFSTDDDGLVTRATKRAIMRAARAAVTPPTGRRGLTVNVYSPSGRLLEVIRGEDAYLPEHMQRDMAEA